MSGRPVPFGRVLGVRVLLVMAVGLAAQLLYTFAFLPYQDLLVSDMGYFWWRAEQHLLGRGHDIYQWVVWPISFHIVLAWVMQAADAIGLHSHRLEFFLTLTALAHASCVYAVYRIAEQLSYARQDVATMAAGLYAISPPLLHLNGHVLSESFSIPAMIWAIYLIVCKPLRYKAAGLSGLLFGASVAMRPAFGLFGLVYVALMLIRLGWGEGAKRVFAFTAAFCIPLFGAVLATSHYSDGKVRGLGANGALVFFMHQCRPGGWAIINEALLRPGEKFNDCALYRRLGMPLRGSRFVHTSMEELEQCNGRIYGQPPALMEFKDRPFFITSHMPWEQAYFYRLGLSCIKANGLWKQFKEDVWQLRKLFIFFYPDKAFDGKDGKLRYSPMYALIIAWNALFFLAGLLGPAASWLRRREVPAELLALSGIPFLALVTSFVFAIDGRYLAPTLFVGCLYLARLRLAR